MWIHFVESLQLHIESMEEHLNNRTHNYEE